LPETTTKDEELVKRAESARGKVLRDKWRLDQVLGIGGMATVYSATHRNGKRAAVKILHPEAALAPTVKERFLHEGYLANKVDHPGAVSILDDDVDADGTVFLVMELLNGETLDSRLNRSGSKLGAAELLQIVDQVLDCLNAAHSKGIVHRDLKPGNLFVTAGGAMKVLDFGIARLDSGEKGRTGGTGGQTLGTPGFMPPEQARGRWDEVDAQSDLWAMGAVMFVALTGHHVHEAPTVNEQLLAAMTVPARPIREIVADVADPVADLVDRALSFAKDARWPNARSMREAVRAAYESVAGRPLEQAPRLSIRPPSSTSVNPDDATIDAAAAEAAPPGQTTARPVTTPLATPGGRLTVGLALAAIVVLGAGGYAVFHGSAQKPVQTGPLAHATIEPARTTNPTEPGPTVTPTAIPEAREAPSATASPQTRTSPPAGALLRKPSKSPAISPPSSAKPVAPAPPASKPDDAVDLFSRRK